MMSTEPNETEHDGADVVGRRHETTPPPNDGLPGSGDTRVTVIGAGMLGSALASAFMAAGHSTTVWNRSTGKVDDLIANGAIRATTIGEAIAASPLIVLCVSNYEAVREVVEPLRDHLAGRVLANLTSGTPEEARSMATWAAQRGAEYLDGAAMGGTRLVGRPDALFLFSGSPAAFAAHEAALGALGNVTDLGRDAGLASLYDTALFGVGWSTLAGFYHALALVRTEDVDARSFASAVTSFLPFLAWLIEDHSRQVEAGRYPGDDGTVEIHAAAMDHLTETSRQHDVGVDVPEFLKALLVRAIAAGHGDDGMASVIEVIRQPGDVGDR